MRSIQNNTCIRGWSDLTFLCPQNWLTLPASKQHHKVISRRSRRQIDRWCCFYFPNRTRFVGLRFGFYWPDIQNRYKLRIACGEFLCFVSIVIPRSLRCSSFPNQTRLRLGFDLVFYCVFKIGQKLSQIQAPTYSLLLGGMRDKI